MSDDWLNENVPIHKVYFDERGHVKDLDALFAEPCCEIHAGTGVFEAMIYVLVDKNDAVIIDDELCWGRMLLQLHREGEHGSTFFMKTDYTHSQKIGRKNYICW